MGFLLRCLLICGLGVTFARGTEKAATKVDLPAPPFPLYGDHSGTVTLEVLFDSSGNVASCTVQKSSGSRELDKETSDFAKGHWHAPAYAGQTIDIPICYQPISRPYGTPVVPNLLLPSEPSVSLHMWVSFNSDGYVKSFGTYQMSGHAEIDRRVMNWIYTNWRTKDYKHQTVDVRLRLDPPLPGAKANASDVSTK